MYQAWMSQFIYVFYRYFLNFKKVNIIRKLYIIENDHLFLL